MTCIIFPASDGYVILDDGDAVLAGPFAFVTEALEEAEAQGLAIGNMDEVEEWRRLPDDWGLD